MGIVIKYGGNAMTDAATRRSMAARIRDLAASSEPPVLVHGGGPFIQAALDAAGLDHRFVRGLRVTTEASLEVVERELTVLGKRLAHEIGPAVAVTGRDARLLLGDVASEELGRVGHVRAVEPRLLTVLRGAGLVPVVACLVADEAGGLLNVNADEVAGAVAGALDEGVIYLTNVPGVLDDPADPASLLATLSAADAAARIADGRIAGGMIPKVEAALAALAVGAPFAVIADGRDPSGVDAALAGGGTRLALK